MDVRVCLCTICGIPASGKSSFCERLYHHLVNEYLVICINYDNILLSPITDKVQLHESLLLQNEAKIDDAILKVPRQQILQLVEIIIQHLRNKGALIDVERLEGLHTINKDVQQSFLSSCKSHFQNTTENPRDVLILLDDNFYLSSMRYDFYKMARQYDTGFCEIFLHSSTEKAITRNKLREGKELVSNEVIMKMAKKFEPPEAAKNHWERFNMTITAEDSIDIVLPMIKEAFANPVQPIPQIDEREQAMSQAACSKSLIHQVDLILRQCVRSSIASGKQSSKDVRLVSKRAMATKEDILNDLKNGHINIPVDDLSTVVQDASKDENCDLYKHVYSLFNEKLNTQN